jgi:cytoskeletal protein CcmA (bactofilin family)
MPRQSSEPSVVGPSTKIVGSVAGDGPLRIEGSVRGGVQITGDAEIAAGGSLEGNLSAAAVDVAGQLQGDVTARGPVTIQSGAVVRGELHGSEVSIEPGARVSVRISNDFQLELAPTRARR